MRSRQRIVDATQRLIGRVGFEGVSVAAIAVEAGVSRQTIYTIFGTKEDTVSAAVASMVVDALGDIELHTASAVTAADYVVELLVVSRRVVLEHPVLRSLVSARDGNPIHDVGMLERGKSFARELLAPVLVRDPGLAASLDDLVEFSIRIALTVVLFDDDGLRADDDLRAFMRRWLDPYVAARH